MKKWLLRGIAAAALGGASVYLLRGDAVIFWIWYLLAGLLGMAAMPVTGLLFRNFDDRGWMFSKVLAIAGTGFLTWWLVSAGFLAFTGTGCVAVTVTCVIVCAFLYLRQMKRGEECLPLAHFGLVFWEEVLFFAMFLMWTYFAGFHPAAYGTEKFMDYGFMEAMMRSTVLPPRDLWYSQGHINYYYGGQYFAVFLTKLSGGKVEQTYNLMRTFVAALAFALPFSLVYQMARDRMGGLVRTGKKWIPAISGLIAGTAVSVAGNMHYVIYGVILPLLQRWRGEEAKSYWFPDATRYIGFNPEVDDKTIHEFPCYSFVLGDLHAHVVNIMFVLLLIGLLYAWTGMVRKNRDRWSSGPGLLRKHLTMPHLLIVSVLLGMFQWTNYWDFVIYYVVTGGTVVFANVILFRGKFREILRVTGAQAVEVMGIAFAAIIPFNMQFETMVQGVALAKHHSLPHQLAVLWGLPVMVTVLFLITLLRERLRHTKKGSLYALMRGTAAPDLFGVVLGLCAMGLVLIPELVYVRDIYENGNARANTMFKLTYQAYIMFGILMGYAICRMLAISRSMLVKLSTAACLFFLIWTCGYFGKSVDSWFGNVFDRAGYQGLDATRFLSSDFPQDASAIHWLKENVDGVPVVLEANGDSYTGYERVSAMTGLPTVLGWYVHEWLWRNDVGDLNEKSGDVETIYTSADETLVRTLVRLYEVEYIFVGSKEQEKYGERLNREVLGRLGTEVFRDSETGTYILKVS